MSDRMTALLGRLGYDAGQLRAGAHGVDLMIDKFDSSGGGPNLAVTTACNCVQYPSPEPLQ